MQYILLCWLLVSVSSLSAAGFCYTPPDSISYYTPDSVTLSALKTFCNKITRHVKYRNHNELLKLLPPAAVLRKAFPEINGLNLSDTQTEALINRPFDLVLKADTIYAFIDDWNNKILPHLNYSGIDEETIDTSFYSRSDITLVTVWIFLSGNRGATYYKIPFVFDAALLQHGGQYYLLDILMQPERRNLEILEFPPHKADTTDSGKKDPQISTGRLSEGAGAFPEPRKAQLTVPDEIMVNNVTITRKEVESFYKSLETGQKGEKEQIAEKPLLHDGQKNDPALMGKILKDPKILYKKQ